MSQDLSGTPTQIHTSRALRILLVGVGLILTGVGIVGIVLPLLPGMPFLILAAACFARSNDRAYRWLLEHRLVGPSLHAWRTHRRIPRWVKPRAILAVMLAFGASAYFALDAWWSRLLWLAAGVGVALFIAQLPSHEEPAADGRSQTQGRGDAGR